MEYLSCCTSEIMKPKPKICGETIEDFPQIPDDLPPKRQEEINDVSMNS